MLTATRRRTQVRPGPAAADRSGEIRRSLRALGGNQDFRRIWIGQAISEMGTSVSTLSMPLLTLALSGSALGAGVVGTVAFCGSLIGQVPAGHLADVWDKRRLLIASDLVRGACMAGVAVMALTGWFDLRVMLGLTAVNMFAFGVTGPAQIWALRAVVSPAELADASALIQGRSYTVSLVTPTIGGFLFAAGRVLPFLADAVSYLGSAACTARVVTSLAPDPAEPRPRFAVSFARGWTVLWQTRLIRWLTGYSAVANLVVSTLIFTILLGSGASPGAARGLGVTVTLAGLAGLVGSVLAPGLQRRLKLHAILVATCTFRVLAVVPAILAPSLPTRSFAMIMVVLSAPAVQAAVMTARTLAVPPAVLGSVSGAAGLVATCTQPLAPLLGGLLLAQAGPSVAFALVGGAFLLLAGALLLPAELRVPAASPLRVADSAESIP